MPTAAAPNPTRYRAIVEYDGSRYYGFQRQVATQITIQGELEGALSRIAGRPVVVSGAGRTDRGVHALGQVISFCLDWPHGVAALQRALNANLPADIVAHQVAVAAPGFHPRFDARQRAYRYTIWNGVWRRPLLARTSWHVAHPLDVGAMQRAADHLIGVHDFGAFGQPTDGDSTVREVLQATWERAGELLVFDIVANAFLKHMVRRLVGALKVVGEGLWSEGDFAAALRAADRSCSAATAPPQGLVLISVRYADDCAAPTGRVVENE